MAKSTQTSSTLRTVAIFGAAVLIGAAALVYLNGGASPDTSELAALSQALPSQTQAALSGEEGAFDRLARSRQRLAELQRTLGSSAGGRAGDWQALESGVQAVTANRQLVEAAALASADLRSASAEARVLADQLLDRSGATTIIQESARRLDSINRAAYRLLLKPDAAGEIALIGEHVAYVRDMVNGLSGERSSLDIRPLAPAGRQQVVEPLAELVTTMESAFATLAGNPGEIAGLAATQAQVTGAAGRLLDAGVGRSASSGMLPAALSSRWIPLALIAAAVLLIFAMVFLSNKLASFESVAQEQAEQNERNQQAILRLLDEMGSLADGDLTVEATVTEDITGTIADSFNFAIEELRKLVATVNETAIMVDTASKQTENTAAHMARAAENQSREISAATESIVSMAASIEEVSGNAERSSDVARHSVEVAHKGGEAVRRTIDGMNTIRETIQDTSKRIKRLGESSQEIGNIVELINDIAEQTNILALNASIQASMAGEAGRGFAVVADEVQRLAERSTNATKQIEVLVSTIQADTKEAVVSMERSTTDVVGGALLAENAGAALDEIEQVSNQIASLVQNISGSARQQASAAADVTRRTTRLREISEQTGKATTATAAAIAKLSEFASQLRKSVAGFTLPEDAMQGGTLVTNAPQPARPPATPAPGGTAPQPKQVKTG
ncbi:MAG: methyl-accepting chemotaxis protein [Woeseiaceae bacterium]|jgi:twitching motility protein PilJ|nr:methyl-accepting chemotaxis protein [Woeseiaceae bacterium]